MTKLIGMCKTEKENYQKVLEICDISQTTKTDAGTRVLPITEDVAQLITPVVVLYRIKMQAAMVATGKQAKTFYFEIYFLSPV